MRLNIASTLILLLACIVATPVYTADPEPVPFVMQLTRNSDSYGHRRAFLQIDKVLSDLGEKNLKIEVACTKTVSMPC